MTPAAALTPESFDLISLFVRADWVVKLVMIGLAAASLWSWTIILEKLFRFHTLNRDANAFEDAVASGRSLEDVAADAGDQPVQALPRMLQAALKEWRDGRGRGGATEGQLAFLVQRIDRTLDTIIARESARVETGLGGLAIVATASPFVGLFGTVWGIMQSFQAIAIQKNTSLAIVAPRSPRRCSPPPSGWSPPSRPTFSTTPSPPAPPSTPDVLRALPTISPPQSSVACRSGPDPWRCRLMTRLQRVADAAAAGVAPGAAHSARSMSRRWSTSCWCC
jgi:biopolymer transport protein TolQ